METREVSIEAYREVEGNLITLAKEGAFDVIAHGCNCHCSMGAGIAPQMAKAFGADEFWLEGEDWEGEVNKLGMIDFETLYIHKDSGEIVRVQDVVPEIPFDEFHTLTVVNAYTQFGFGRNHKGGSAIPLDYEAITLCMRKMNNYFEGKHIGLPQIGAGLAGGDWEKIKQIIKDELVDCTVTVVIFNEPNKYVSNRK